MKLILCNECSDVFSLKMEEKRCTCGKSHGRYVDNLNAEIGGPCTPLGFANWSFKRALQMQRIEDKHQVGMEPSCCKGVEFDAFVIPAVATSVRRVDEPLDGQSM